MGQSSPGSTQWWSGIERADAAVLGSLPSWDPWSDSQPLLAQTHSCPISHFALKGERRTGKNLLEIMRWMP